MMKFLLVIAMFAMARLGSTSPVDLGDKEFPDSMEDFKESLQSLVSDFSKQLKENAIVDENMDFESFVRENKLDDEETSITEEEEFNSDEFSALEEDQYKEDAESGLHCSWRRLAGHCCKRIRISKLHLYICIAAVISPPTSMRVALAINGRVIWHHSVSSRHSYNVCLKKGHFKLCLQIYNLYVSSHSARLCLKLYAKWHFIHVHKGFGCLYKRYADSEISTAEEAPSQPIEKQKVPKHIDDFPSNPKMRKQSDNTLRFNV